jgi:hypothetical protein
MKVTYIILQLLMTTLSVIAIKNYNCYVLYL